MAVSGGRGLVVHHGDLDPLRVTSDTQTDERDLDDGQQELETQRAADEEESQNISETTTCNSSALLLITVIRCVVPRHPLHPHHRLDHQGGDVPPLRQHVSGSHLPVR